MANSVYNLFVSKHKLIGGIYRMADLKVLKSLMKHAINGTVPTEFSDRNVDINSALRDELNKLMPDFNSYRRNKLDAFELLQETIDEILPMNVKNTLGMFAEIKQVNNGQKSVFTQKLGKYRAKRFITRVSPSGVYETFRLDKKDFELYPDAYGGAFAIDFERMLDGSETMSDGYEIIQTGIEEQVYTEIQKALIASWGATRPARTKKTYAGFDTASMDEMINHVRAFGAPQIICSPQFAAEMSSAIVYKVASGANPNVAVEDLTDIRERGYVGKYKGVPVIVMPQSFDDEEFKEWTINPRIGYVLPAGEEKIVKVSFEGNTIIDDYQNRDNSYEIQGYKKFAVGLLNTKNWGIYQNSNIDSTATDKWPILTV